MSYSGSWWMTFAGLGLRFEDGFLECMSGEISSFIVHRNWAVGKGLMALMSWVCNIYLYSIDLAGFSVWALGSGFAVGDMRDWGFGLDFVSVHQNA